MACTCPSEPRQGTCPRKWGLVVGWKHFPMAQWERQVCVSSIRCCCSSLSPTWSLVLHFGTTNHVCVPEQRRMVTSPLGSTCCEHASLDSMAEPSCRAVLPGRPGQRHCGVGQATGRTLAPVECVVDQKPAAKLVLQMERSRWALQQPEDCLASALLPDAFQDAPGVPLAQAPSITNCLRCCREDACWSQHCQARPRLPLHLSLAYLWHLAGIPSLDTEPYCV